MGFDETLVGQETTLLGPLIPPAPLKGAPRSSEVEISLPPPPPLSIVLPSAPREKSKEKGKVVKEPTKKRKWLDELSATERAALTQTKRELLSRQEGQYLNKRLEAKECARQRALDATGGSSTVGKTFFDFLFASSLSPSLL